MSELYEKKAPENSRDEVERVQQSLSARWGTWSWLAFANILNDIPALAGIYPLSWVG